MFVLRLHSLANSCKRVWGVLFFVLKFAIYKTAQIISATNLFKTLEKLALLHLDIKGQQENTSPHHSVVHTLMLLACIIPVRSHRSMSFYLSSKSTQLASAETVQQGLPRISMPFLIGSLRCTLHRPTRRSFVFFCDADQKLRLAISCILCGVRILFAIVGAILKNIRWACVDSEHQESAEMSGFKETMLFEFRVTSFLRAEQQCGCPA